MKSVDFERFLRWFIVGLFVVSGAISFWYGEWVYVFISLIALIPVIYPRGRMTMRGVSFSNGLNLFILLFVYAAIFLGELHQFYVRFWWWDILLHSFSAIVLGLLGFSIVYFLNSEDRCPNLSPLFVAIFGFSFSIMIGVLWEIFEFSVDYFLGFNMQKSGVVDTMTDLIVNGLGALVVSCWGYLSLKGNFKETFDFFRSIIIKS
ncbi:hypothetical protein K8R30_04220 [archaeon]|nr:hypothetical protein [archaeon]